LEMLFFIAQHNVLLDTSRDGTLPETDSDSTSALNRATVTCDN